MKKNADYESLNKAFQYIQTQTNNFKPRVGIILGSGLGGVAEEIENAMAISYKDIPGMMTSSAPGHDGIFIFGKLEDVPIVAMKGRLHFYEGYQMEEVVYPIRLMALMGIEKLVISNAAGGIDFDFSPGDLMVIEDHINFLGTNPLIGQNEAAFGVRFPDMSNIYTKAEREKLFQAAKEEDISLQSGVYIACTGPSYETPAEIKAFRTLGAQAVGMSTVPEAIVAAHAGIKVLGISCISNMASGILDQPLTEEEVLTTGRSVESKMTRLLRAYLRL